MSTESAFCRLRAAEARSQADAATLDNVRERCLRAEAAWLAMAQRGELTDSLRAARQAAPVAADHTD